MQFFDSVGLGDLKDEKYARALFQYVCEKPKKAFKGYCGFYAYSTMGDVEFSCHIIEKDDGTANEVIGLSMHVMGNEFATLPIGDNGVLDEDTDELSRCVSFETKDGGQVPIRLVMADVLPTYAPGTRVEMQLASFALEVNYYRDDDDWQTNRGGELFGKPISIADGAILSLGTDDTCRIKGRVKRVVEKHTISPRRTAKYTTFLAVYVDTAIGELPIYHTADAAAPNERALIRPGSIVDVIAVISADVAIGEYQGGAIFDEKHLLMLIRDCVENGDWRRLRNVLADDTELNNGEYITGFGDKSVLTELTNFSNTQRVNGIELFGQVIKDKDRYRLAITRDDPYKRSSDEYTSITIDVNTEYRFIQSMTLLPVDESRFKRPMLHSLDEESALRAIMHGLELDYWSEVYSALADDCAYIRGSADVIASGRAEVIEKLYTLAQKCVADGARIFAYLCTITGHPSDRECDQPVGRRGVLALYDRHYVRSQEFDVIFFVDLDEDGLIKRIYISHDPYLVDVEETLSDLVFEYGYDELEEDDFDERKIPTPDPSEDFKKAFLVAGKHIQHHARKMEREAGWVRSHPFPPYIEHLSFILGGEYFLVLIEDFHKTVEMPGNRRNLIRKARACNGRACVMPMVKSGLLMSHMTGYMTVKEIEELEWTPLLSGCGLIDAETGETINLAKYGCDRDVELTDWELLEFAVSAIRSKLETEQGRQIMSCQSDPDVLPNIWFVGDDGPEWVIVRAVRWPQERAELPSDWRQGMAGTEKLSRRGSFASVSFASDDRRNSGLILRGKMADFEFPGFEKLTI